MTRMLARATESSARQRARTVTLTNSEGTLPELPALLEGRGFAVESAPLLKAVPRLDASTRRRTLQLIGVRWLLLTSRNAVRALEAIGFPFDRTATRIGAVGPGTAAELRRCGAEVTVTPERHDALGLAHSLLEHPEAGGPVGLPRGNRSLPTLAEELTSAGLEVRSVIVYDTTQSPWAGVGSEVIVLASPSAVHALPVQEARARRLVAIGATTAAAVAGHGWECTVAREATAEAVAEAVEEAWVK